MRRAERERLRDEETKARAYAEMPLRDLEALIEPARPGKCDCCYLCIEHPGCLAEHPPPSWCTGALHHYLWRTRHRAERLAQHEQSAVASEPEARDHGGHAQRPNRLR